MSISNCFAFSWSLKIFFEPCQYFSVKFLPFSRSQFTDWNSTQRITKPIWNSFDIISYNISCISYIVKGILQLTNTVRYNPCYIIIYSIQTLFMYSNKKTFLLKQSGSSFIWSDLPGILPAVYYMYSRVPKTDTFLYPTDFRNCVSFWIVTF